MAPRKNPLELDSAGFEPGRTPPATDYVAQLQAPKDEQRGKSCFDLEESGQAGGSTAPLINEKRPTL